MIKVQLSCKSCYGVFDVSKSFFNDDDNPRFCAFCGKEQIIEKDEYEIPKNGLTSQQRSTLSVFLLMTTKYREDQEKACRKLSKELDDDGNPIYPNMAANADWWRSAIDTVDEVIALL